MENHKYPYTTVPGKLRKLLKSAPNMGRPDKLTVAWLKKAGYTSSNDPSMLPVLKFVNVLGSDGRPTELWDAVRAPSQESRLRLGGAIREAYGDLFALYPDAHRKDTEALRNFFRANTDGGEQVQSKLVQTFQVLSEFADFDGEAPAVQTPGNVKARAAAEPSRSETLIPKFPGMTLNVNIQLQLPATSDGEVYEKLFASMRKHLMGLTETS